MRKKAGNVYFKHGPEKNPFKSWFCFVAEDRGQKAFFHIYKSISEMDITDFQTFIPLDLPLLYIYMTCICICVILQPTDTWYFAIISHLLKWILFSDSFYRIHKFCLNRSEFIYLCIFTQLFCYNAGMESWWKLLFALWFLYKLTFR